MTHKITHAHFPQGLCYCFAPEVHKPHDMQTQPSRVTNLLSVRAYYFFCVGQALRQCCLFDFIGPIGFKPVQAAI